MANILAALKALKEFVEKTQGKGGEEEEGKEKKAKTADDEGLEEEAEFPSPEEILQERIDVAEQLRNEMELQKTKRALNPKEVGLLKQANDFLDMHASSKQEPGGFITRKVTEAKEGAKEKISGAFDPDRFNVIKRTKSNLARVGRDLKKIGKGKFFELEGRGGHLSDKDLERQRNAPKSSGDAQRQAFEGIRKREEENAAIGDFGFEGKITQADLDRVGALAQRRKQRFDAFQKELEKAGVQ